MNFRTLKDLDAKGLRVFLRADLNVPLKDGVITDATRIRETLPTLSHLLDQGAAVVLASHLGRPKGEGFEAAFSLAPVAAWLKEHGFDVRLASGVVGESVEAEAKALKPGQVLLLENLRFEKGESLRRGHNAAAGRDHTTLPFGENGFKDRSFESSVIVFAMNGEDFRQT